MSTRPKNVNSTADMLTVRRYLCVSSTGSTRIVSTPPSLDSNEIAMLVTLELPKALFRRPSLTAKITIPPSAAVADNIQANVADNVAEAIKKATGLTATVTIVNPEN